MKLRRIIPFIALALIAVASVGYAASNVAVLDSPGTNELNIGLADFIEAGLQKEGVATYDRSFVRVWLGERELSRSGVVDFKTVHQAQLPAVNLFVRGEVHSTSTNQFSLTLEAVRAVDATVAISLQADGRYPQEWLPTLERLVKEMSARLRETQLSAGKLPPGRAITWMPEASLWFFRGMDCYASGDYAQAVIAFGKARRWEQHFRLAWLWEARSYQRMGFAAAARRVLEAGHLSDQPIGQAVLHPVFVVVAGNGISRDEKEEFSRQLASAGQISVLDPRWIGASAREVDLQFTGEMAARTEAGNAWLVVDQLVFLERISLASGQIVFHARQQNGLTGEMELQAEAPITTNGLDKLAQKILAQKESDRRPDAPVPSAGAAPNILPVNSAEVELSRCLDRARRNPADVRALLAVADACQSWEMDKQFYNGQLERGVEWRVREEFLAQAVEAIRKNPAQKDAAFWLASALWRQRYTPEYGIWAGSASGTPLREQMQPLLTLFPQSADATNLAETVSENIMHNRRSLPADKRYLQPPFPPEKSLTADASNTNAAAVGEARLAEFRSDVAQKRLGRAGLLFWQLPSAEHSQDQVFQDELHSFMKLMQQDQEAHDVFMNKLVAVQDAEQLTQLRAQWKPCFDVERRQQEVLALCDSVTKFSGVSAGSQFLRKQFQQYLDDYGQLENPNAQGLPNPLLERLRQDSARFAGAGKLEDADRIDELICRTPEIPQGIRLTTAYDQAVRCYSRADYFQATEILRAVMAEVETGDITIPRGRGGAETSAGDVAYALLKHIRLFDAADVDFRRCCDGIVPPPAADPTATAALEKLFQERMSLTLSIGRPSAEKLDHTHQEMNRVENAMLGQYQAALPAFLYRKILQSGPDPETMGLCARLGTNALPLLPQIVAGVCQFDNSSTRINALYALSNIGKAAACTLPVVILAMETDDLMGSQSAARKTRALLGVAPRRAVPFLARLLYHSDPVVAANAAEAVFAAAALPADFRQGLNADEFILRMQSWWENTGSWQTWE
jgi:tetratricopeptide (TPR) repeat protein